MARLKGNSAEINLMTPFSTRKGGRVYDLSKELHFEIQWDGTNAVDRFTGDVLNGSGHSTVTGPTTSQSGFLVNGTSYFPNLVPNLAWTNDEFTISFWVSFKNIGFSSPFSFYRQFDFLSSRIVGATDGRSDRRFSSMLKRNSSGGVRAYFGLANYDHAYSPGDDPTSDYMFNFCDTYRNKNLIVTPAADHSTTFNSYPSENADGNDIPFTQWNHIVIRSKTRKNGSSGVCELWLNGKLCSSYIQSYSNAYLERPFDKQPPGSGVFSSEQMVESGKINFIYTTSGGAVGNVKFDYPSYMPFFNDKLHLKNHRFFQIAKWDRTLTDLEIKALYDGTLNGVYIERSFSMSSPPRKRDAIASSQIEKRSIGYFDSNIQRESSYNESFLPGNSIGFFGKNSPVSSFDGEEHLEMSAVIDSSTLQSNYKKNKNKKIDSFIDFTHSNLLNCIDGTTANSVVKIDISSVERNDNLQYAGRIDSKFAHQLHQIPHVTCSMFLSSALRRHSRLSSEYLNIDSGVAGTGFLYYSPKKGCWVEKRNQHENSFGTNTRLKDQFSATNSIEINSYAIGKNGGFIVFPGNNAKYDVIRERLNPPYHSDDEAWYVSKMQITGTNEIMGQFTSSPQLSYFLNSKKYLESAGYKNIGSPTVVFGAPFSPKYHAFDDETIKLNNFIDGPFLLKKAILRIPVEIQRINERNNSQYEGIYGPVAYFNFEEQGSSPGTVDDITGNGHVATLYNDATASMNDTPGNIQGRGCLDVSHNAVSSSNVDYLLVSHSDDLYATSTGFSISFWMKFDSSPSSQVHYLVFKGASDGSDSEYYAAYNGAIDSLTFRINDTTSMSPFGIYYGRKITSLSSYVDFSSWNHVSLCYDGNGDTGGSNSFSIYINGVKRDDSDDEQPPALPPLYSPKNNSYPIFIGSKGGLDTTSDAECKIASITFWDKLLSADEVNVLYNNALAKCRYAWSWTSNVTMRKDMDNYVFFLYRQRRSNPSGVVDSIQDISSSARFLVGSGSVCVYNSSSFGLASQDGFTDAFGINTPITSSFSKSTTRKIYLNEMIASASSGVDPITFQNLGETANFPLHTPSVSINTELDDFDSGGTYLERKFLEIQIDPAYVMGGYPNNSLMYVTTSKGHLSTSFYSLATEASYDSDFCNKLFNWYPQKGSSLNIFDQSFVPPITTILQNFWFGGTRQPSISTNASPNYQPPGSLDSAVIEPYFQFSNSNILKTTNSLKQTGVNSSKPQFDIEVARTGVSLYNLTKNAFSEKIQLVNDGRGALSSFVKDSTPNIAATFQRTDLINFTSYNGETLSSNAGTFSIGSLSGSSFIDLVSSLTVGYAPCSSNAGRNVYNPYVLLPEDELILGLDAGITPPPDVAPTLGKPMPDKNEIGDHKDSQSPFINPILREQIWHYSGNSYMRILPGKAEIILVGDYVNNGSKILRNRDVLSPDISTIVGDDPIMDTYENSETDAYFSTMHSQVFAGVVSRNGDENNWTRVVVKDNAEKGAPDIHTMKRYFQASSDSLFIADLYLSGAS